MIGNWSVRKGKRELSNANYLYKNVLLTIDTHSWLWELTYLCFTRVGSVIVFLFLLWNIFSFLLAIFIYLNARLHKHIINFSGLIKVIQFKISTLAWKTHYEYYDEIVKMEFIYKLTVSWKINENIFPMQLKKFVTRDYVYIYMRVHALNNLFIFINTYICLSLHILSPILSTISGTFADCLSHDELKMAAKQTMKMAAVIINVWITKKDDNNHLFILQMMEDGLSA